MLIDQKDSAGEKISLFGKNVKTQIGFLKIARKYNMQSKIGDTFDKTTDDIIYLLL